MSNNEFFNTLIVKVSPAIAYKVYWEYSKSFNYNVVKDNTNSKQIIKVQSTVNSTIEYQVNLMNDSCSCYRLIYLGIPCCHMFGAWRYAAQNI